MLPRTRRGATTAPATKMWKQLLHRKAVRHGTSPSSSYTYSYHVNTTGASCSYELPSDVYSPDGATVRIRRRVVMPTPAGERYLAEAQVTGPFNSTFEDKYITADLTDSFNFPIRGVSQLEISELANTPGQCQTSPCSLLTSVTLISEQTLGDRPYSCRVLGERPPCIGQEATPPKQSSSRKRHFSVLSTDEAYGDLPDSLAEQTAESDATAFMKRPINRRGLATNRRRCHTHKAIGQKLKQFGKQFHALRKSSSTKEILAIV